MGYNSNIAWCDHTWNIARGCSKVDQDCLYCYMYRDGKRYGYDAKTVVKTKTVFNLPLKIKDTSSNCWGGKPLIFTSSLTDVFHPEIDSYRDEMWDIIRKCPHLIFQILTKRPERIIDHLPEDWETGYPNVWFGTSVGSNHSIQRVRKIISLSLRRPVAKLFLSLEPLYGPIDLNDYYFNSRCFNRLSSDERTKMLELVNWVIIGGESGNETGNYRYRECKLEWIEELVSDAQRLNIPVFVKQLGTHLSKTMGLKHRHGADINEWPKHLQIREFPNETN